MGRRKRTRLTYRGQEMYDPMYKKLQIFEDEIEDGKLIRVDALDRAVAFMVQSRIEYCSLCPNLKRCTEQIDKKPDGKWQPRKSVCIAGLKKYFIQGEQKT